MKDKLTVATTVAELRAAVDAWRKGGARVALIPTLGSLHEGHLSHVPAAAGRADRIVVSIFVNPAQFAPHEDFERYPRQLEKDCVLLAATGRVDLVYAPAVAEMYPTGFATKVMVEGPGAGLETDFRPHFFAGVATVVTKLFTQCRPDVATFGEKDYQQLLVVKRLAKDLDLGIEIVGVPTSREPDGLALSSRNAYLSAEQRAVAAHLNRVLGEVAVRAKDGISIPQAEAEGAASLLNAGFDRVDYVALRDSQTLFPIRVLSAPARVLAAARVGGVRLIDNMGV